MVSVRTFLAVLAAIALALTIAWGVTSLGFYNWHSSADAFRAWTLVCWALFALAFLALRLVPTKHATAVVLLGAALIGGAAIVGPPNTSTDSARYAWDGILQNEGISPYAFAPNDDATAKHRPEWLFPAPVTAPEKGAGAASPADTCTGIRVFTTTVKGTDQTLCTTINRPTVFTIYPPAAELYFAAVRAVVTVDVAYWPMQVVGLLLSLAITLGLVILLRRHSLDVRWAALWAWCPLVASEAVTNSHVDALGAGLALLATGLVVSGRRWWGGVALGASIATKLIPVISAPALLRKRPLGVIVAAVVTFALLYVPYVVTTGIKVLGFLPGYLSEEGYDSGDRFTVVSLFAPGKLAAPVAVLILLVVAIAVWRTSDPASPWLGQVVMIGATFLVISPRYPWYALLLIPFIAMTGRWEWQAITLALSIRQFWPYPNVSSVTLIVALALIVIVSIRRSGPGWRRRMLDRTRAEWHGLRELRLRRRGAASR